MLPALLLCSMMFSADIDAPASALDAVALAQLPDRFAEPDAETAALFAMPVARVNGHVVTAGLLLSRYDDYLQHIRGRRSPDEYSQIVHEIIQRELPNAIMTEVVWNDVEANVPAENLANARQQFDRVWELEKLRLARELAGQLRSPVRTSLESLREWFVRRGLIQSYLTSKFSKLPSDEFWEYRTQLLRDARIETAYVVSLDELK